MPQEAPASSPADATESTDTPSHILVTGVTGFVGQALLERLLAGTSARVSVLIRPRAQASAEDRFADLMTAPVFTPWRRRIGEEAAREEVARRVTLISGDLLDLPELPRDLDAVVHSASTVSFDEPIDVAFRTNVAGPANLYRALSTATGTGVTRPGTAVGAAATGDASDPAGKQPRRVHVVHLSTSYVSTGRVDVAAEASLDHDVDWRAELADALAHAPRHEGHGLVHGAGASLTMAHRRHLGRQRAHELGWTDSYTLTKALGERVAEELWAEAGQPLTVLRPTIIESALRHPYPGWLDGFKVADPLIAAYAQGRLPGFPGHPSNVLDLIPVDFVVNAVLATLRQPPEPGHPAYLQVGSGTTNPLHLAQLRLWVQEYFAHHPWIDRHGNQIRPEPWDFSDPDELARRTVRRQRALQAANALLDRLPERWLRRQRADIRMALRRLTAMRAYVDLYQPYTCAATVFDDTAARSLESTTSHPRDTFDVRTIDWKRYLTQAHLPAVVGIMESRNRVPAGPTAHTIRSHAQAPSPGTESDGS